MNNPVVVNIQRTVFQSVRQDGSTETTKTFGYRMYNNDGCIYNDTMTEENLHVSDEEFFRYIHYLWRTNDSDGSDAMMSFLVCGGGGGVFIDKNWHDWEWVKKVLDTVG